MKQKPAPGSAFGPVAGDESPGARASPPAPRDGTRPTEPPGTRASLPARTHSGLAELRGARPHQKSGTGLLYALSAYAIWGFIPLYFRALSHVPPLVVLCHRVIWSAIFIALIVSIRKEWKPVLLVVKRRRNILLLSAGAIFIALNWLIFIYAVVTKQLLQASLGYFINPLLSVALGMIFLRERLQRWQWLAVALALLAVANLALHSGGAAWISVSLAVTFGSYGLVRKKVDVNSLHGLLIESSLLLPMAVLGLVFLPAPAQPAGTFGLLSLSGIITAVPLLCFGAAVRQLSLATMGFLQYLGPTLQFMVAVWVFAEPVDRAKLGSFVLCWLAIGVYVLDSIVNRRTQDVADEPE